MAEYPFSRDELKKDTNNTSQKYIEYQEEMTPLRKMVSDFIKKNKGKLGKIVGLDAKSKKGSYNRKVINRRKAKLEEYIKSLREQNVDPNDIIERVLEWL